MNCYKLNSFELLASALEKLPSIGKKSARKMAYTLSVDNAHLGMQISELIQAAIANTQKCSVCGSLSSGEVCSICLDEDRKNHKMCIVLHPKDVFLIENIGEFSGTYCVIENYKKFDFNILNDRIQNEVIQEIIFAISPSIQNDMIVLFIQDKIKNKEIKFSKIAQGVPSNISLDNIDHFSLAKAFSDRINIA